MLISSTFSWPTLNWPSTSASAAQYTILQVYNASGPVSPPQPILSVSTNSATLSYDDSQSLAYVVRASSGVAPSLTYGPEASVLTVNYVPCRAWLRQKVRVALADRADVAGATLNWPDDEINGYIEEALSELNLLFPIEEDTQITLLPPMIVNGVSMGVRNYPLGKDFYKLTKVRYTTADGKLQLYLKEKPWRGGESTATSYLGYPKLGILISPIGGRYYPGNYDVYEGQLWLDFDPAGNGDSLSVRYLGKRALPTSDGDILSVQPEDMELLSLYAQLKCWLRTEGQDTRLSRWTENRKRDDQPTIKQSEMIQKLYNMRLLDRRELRPKATLRLVRR